MKVRVPTAPSVLPAPHEREGVVVASQVADQLQWMSETLPAPTISTSVSSTPEPATDSSASYGTHQDLATQILQTNHRFDSHGHDSGDSISAFFASLDKLVSECAARADGPSHFTGEVKCCLNSAATKVEGEDAQKQLFGVLLEINAAVAEALQIQSWSFTAFDAITASHDPPHAPEATVANCDGAAQPSPVLSEGTSSTSPEPQDGSDSDSGRSESTLSTMSAALPATAVSPPRPEKPGQSKRKPKSTASTPSQSPPTGKRAKKKFQKAAFKAAMRASKTAPLVSSKKDLASASASKESPKKG